MLNPNVFIMRWNQSNFSREVLGAEVFEILYGDFSISIPIQDLEVALDISSGWGEDSIEGLVSIYNHGHHFNAINNSISISIIGIEDPSCHVFCTLAVGQTRVDEHGIVGLDSGVVGVAGLLVAVGGRVHSTIFLK